MAMLRQQKGMIRQQRKEHVTYFTIITQITVNLAKLFSHTNKQFYLLSLNTKYF